MPGLQFHDTVCPVLAIQIKYTPDKQYSGYCTESYTDALGDTHHVHDDENNKDDDQSSDEEKKILSFESPEFRRLADTLIDIVLHD